MGVPGPSLLKESTDSMMSSLEYVPAENVIHLVHIHELKMI